MKKIIQYRVREVYGNPLEYVVNEGDANTITHLTGKKTINLVVRSLIEKLSDGMITFERVMWGWNLRNPL